jgi:hypothetical protein
MHTAQFAELLMCVNILTFMGSRIAAQQMLVGCRIAAMKKSAEM